MKCLTMRYLTELIFINNELPHIMKGYFNMNTPNFSVLLSIYKNEKPDFVTDSFKSILNQSLIPNEVILVEDGPLTNELYEVIDSFKKEYPTIFKIVTLKKNVGLGLALNRGLEECSNELVARMDTDDIAKHTRFEKQVNAFIKKPKLSIVGSNVDEFTEDTNEVISQRVVPETHEDLVHFAKRRNPFNHPSVMYKKSDVLSVGGYQDYRRSQDYDLFVRMLNNGYQGYNIQESLLYFRADHDNLGRRKSWVKTKNDILLRYKFFKEGYSSFGDLFITTIGFVLVFITPDSFFEFINRKYLRKSN